MTIKDWDIFELTGYEPKTTFYTDFSIADKFGADAVEDTYNKCLEGWKDDYIYLTELVMVLNWKIWEHYEHNKPLAQLYNTLWDRASEYAENHLTGEELQYYYRTTD